MHRLLFEKKGNAIWISHLDLMRLFQRAFMRAGILISHTQGYNPRPSVSIALPLSVGDESSCEILDFEPEKCGFSCDEIRDRLNDSLVEGVKVLAVYENGKKIKELAFLQCRVCLEYDGGVPEGAADKIRQLFQRDSVLVDKKTKNNGIQPQDIIPMIRELSVIEEDKNAIVIAAIVCCQNPSLNPMQLAAAVEAYLPEVSPDFIKFSRLEIMDANLNVFR
jgi:radical SAM-linked protein